MSPLPDIWLLRSDGERRVNRRLRVKTNFSLKFSKEESPIVRRDSQSLVVLPSLALSISPGGWAGEALASPGRREGWRMSSAGCHCEGRRPTEIDRSHHRHLWLQCSRAGPAYSEQSLSLSTVSLLSLLAGLARLSGRGEAGAGSGPAHLTAHQICQMSGDWSAGCHFDLRAWELSETR